MFQLTTSRRGRLLPFRLFHQIQCCFNSRPHEEVDWYHCLPINLYMAFQLTTSRRGRPLKTYLLSFLKTFQLTTSRRGRLTYWKSLFCPVMFQLTTSRRGRQSKAGVFPAHNSFNSRPHEEVDRALYLVILHPQLFQLTTSRRGRLARVIEYL